MGTTSKGAWRKLGALFVARVEKSFDLANVYDCVIFSSGIYALMRANPISNLIGCAKAATAIEYAFIASLISIAIYAGVSTIGTQLSSVFSTVASSF